MADRVRFVMDRMAPLFKQLEQSGIFSVSEVRSIVQKRTDYEYTMMRFELTTNDIEKYLQYERHLFQLFTLRYEKFKQAKEGQLNRSELDLFRSIKVALIQHIHYIYERSNKKFPMHFPFWFQHIDFLKEHESYTILDTLLGKVLALYPYEIDFWIVAALYELQIKQNLHAARIMMQRGLRVNKHHSKLWKCYFDLELWNLLRAIERQNLLIKKPITTMTDANRKKIEEQQKEKEKETAESSTSTVVTTESEFDHAAEAPLFVVFKYACQALLGLESDNDYEDDDEEEGMKKFEEVVDFARGGLDLKAKLSGLEVLFEMHQASIILSPKLTKDMETLLRSVLHVDDEDNSATLDEDSITLINALMKHLVHLQVKKSLVESKVFDMFSSYQLQLHEQKQQREKEKMKWEIMVAEEEEKAKGGKKKGSSKKQQPPPENGGEADGSDKELSVKVMNEIVSVFQKTSHYVQDLIVALPTGPGKTKKLKGTSAANKVLTAASMMDVFASSFFNVLVEMYRETLSSSIVDVPKPEKIKKTKKDGEENDEEEEEAPVEVEEEEKLPTLETLKELVRERVLNKLNSSINPVESSEEEEDNSVSALVQTVTEWVKSSSVSSSDSVAPPSTTKASKKGSKKTATSSSSAESSHSLTKAQESLNDAIKAFEALVDSGSSISTDDIVKGSITFLTQLEYHRITNTSLSLLSQLFQVSTSSTSVGDAIEYILSVGKKLFHNQEKMPLGESVKEEVIEVVAYWSQLVLQMLFFDELSLDHDALVKVVRDISPLLSLNSVGESLLRYLIANIEDNEDDRSETFFESVCHRIIGNVRIVSPSLRMQWVMVYIENSNDDVETIQKSFEWVMTMKKKNPQLFAGVSLEDFITFVVAASDELANSDSGKKRDSSSVDGHSFLQKVLEIAVQDCGLHHVTAFTDRLVEIYRQQGQHAKANHVLFKRRRAE